MQTQTLEQPEYDQCITKSMTDPLYQLSCVFIHTQLLPLGVSMLLVRDCSYE